MPTKLGFQLHAGLDTATPSALDRLAMMRPSALLVKNSPTLLNQAYDRIGAGPIYLNRQDVADDLEGFINLFGDVQKAAEGFLSQIEPALTSIRWAYHCTPPSKGLSEKQVLFDSLVVKLAAEKYNARLCIGNFLTGTPTATQWAMYRPAIEAAERYGAVVGLQEQFPLLAYVGYGPNANIPDPNATTPRRLVNEIPYPQGFTGAGQLVGRYRHLRDYCRAQKLNIRIVITDMGAGRVIPTWLDRFRPNLGHWRTLIPVWTQLGLRNSDNQYFQDISWMDQHVYSQDVEVVGTCLLAWNATTAPQAEIGTAIPLLDRLQLYLTNAQKDQPLSYKAIPFETPTPYRVEVTRLRVRQLPSMNTKYIGNLDYGEAISATHYTFNDGWLWVKHNLGWSAYAPLIKGQPDYDNAYLAGKLITTPRQDAAVNNFVGTIEEVRRFMQAQGDHLFYISINPTTPPTGARRFNVSVFPAKGGRRIIDQLHPTAGDPLMTPGARKKLRDAGES